MAYNGWTNYETWLAKLWIDNNEGSQEHWLEMARESDTQAPRNEFARDRDQERRIWLAGMLKDSHEEEAEPLVDNSGLFADLLNASLARIDWHEIADSLIQDAEELAA